LKPIPLKNSKIAESYTFAIGAKYRNPPLNYLRRLHGLHTYALLLLREKLAGPARMALPFGMVGAVWVIFRGDRRGDALERRREQNRL
jgi:hypothetical protein